MALKINLRGGDSLLIGTSKLTIASEGYTTVILEGDLPVMRQSDAIRAEDAVTTAQRAVFAMQQFYLTQDTAWLDAFQALGGKEVGDQADQFDQALQLAISGSAFRALKMVKKLL